jgi:Na+-transporting NADH:ubiquinone oxidoreductase subunit NqrD
MLSWPWCEKTNVISDWSAQGVALSGTPLNFRFLGSATGIGSMLALIALGSRQEIIGLAALIGLSIFLYLIQARIALAKSH